jgi:hypothetical protein
LGIEYLIRKPCDIDAIVSRIRDLSQRQCTPVHRIDPTTYVTDVLLSLCLSTKHNGFSYLREAILLMAKELGISVEEIQKVQLAGAFGNYLNPQNACRIGLLPEELLERIEPVGNAAGSGAKLLACDRNLLPMTEKLAKQVAFLELASLPDFSRTFAEGMYFREDA